MSLLSIGSDAYKGLLKHVFQPSNRPSSTPPPPPTSQPAGPPPVGSDPTVDLPKIAGVTFEHRQGVILAMGEHLYDKKELLKAAGFQWDKTGKAWLKKAA